MPGNSSAPGIDRLRFDPHEFSGAVNFFVKRVKLAALERFPSGSSHISMDSSEGNGRFCSTDDNDRDPSNWKGLYRVRAASAGAWSGIACPSCPPAILHLRGDQ